MPVSVTMPRLGESVTEGTVTRWLKQEGERVDEDETAEVGSELAVIDGGGPAPAEPQEAQQQQPAERATVEEERPAPPVDEPSTEKPAEAEAPAPAPSDGGGTVVKMPALGESVTEGTVTRWLKQVGDSVEADEPLLEVSTDKVDTEIPAPAAGTLLEIKVNQDETVPV